MKPLAEQIKTMKAAKAKAVKDRLTAEAAFHLLTIREERRSKNQRQDPSVERLLREYLPDVSPAHAFANPLHMSFALGKIAMFLYTLEEGLDEVLNGLTALHKDEKTAKIKKKDEPGFKRRLVLHDESSEKITRRKEKSTRQKPKTRNRTR